MDGVFAGDSIALFEFINPSCKLPKQSLQANWVLLIILIIC